MIFSIFSTFYYLRCSAHPRSKFEISKRMSRTWSSLSRSTLRNSISKGSIRSTRGCFCSSWRGRGTSLERSVNKFLSFSSLSKFNSFFFLFFITWWMFNFSFFFFFSSFKPIMIQTSFYGRAKCTETMIFIWTLRGWKWRSGLAKHICILAICSAVTLFLVS